VHELDVESQNPRSIHDCKTINTTQLRNLRLF
jgi:hypothetical protein